MSANGSEIKTIRVAYFSGTGGTKRIAEAFRQEAESRGIAADLYNLDAIYRQEPEALPDIEADLLLLLFVVHAFEAPAPVFDWIRCLPRGNARTAVISVSGGGEIWPNTGCRNHCCAALEDRGYEVVYEYMMCMPCNWVIPANDHVSMWMLKAIPKKVRGVLDGLTEGKIRRTHHRLGFVRNALTRWERNGVKEFPKSVNVTESCTGCGWCARHCPVGNISMEEGKPRYLDQCIMCFRCVYGCFAGALVSDSFMVLKQGYDLKALEKRMADVELEPVELCCQGILWSAVKKYLLDVEGY